MTGANGAAIVGIEGTSTPPYPSPASPLPSSSSKLGAKFGVTRSSVPLDTESVPTDDPIVELSVSSVPPAETLKSCAASAASPSTVPGRQLESSSDASDSGSPAAPRDAAKASYRSRRTRSAIRCKSLRWRSDAEGSLRIPHGPQPNVFHR